MKKEVRVEKTFKEIPCEFSIKCDYKAAYRVSKTHCNVCRVKNKQIYLCGYHTKVYCKRHNINVSMDEVEMGGGGET